MKLEIKKKIDVVIGELKNSGKFHLAKQIEENWDKMCLEYSEKLNSYEPEGRMEPELLEVFDKELERLEFDETARKKILSSLEKRRVLQTAPHIVPALGPRMLCLDWLSSIGVPEKEYHVVGMFSGVPFSNNYRSGRIATKQGEVNLIPSVMQDALVYRSKIPAKLPKQIAALPERLRKMLLPAVPGASYTKWAIQSCQRIQRKVLGKNNLVYLDINEVVAAYSLRVLKNPSHIFHKIFFDAAIREKFSGVFPNEIIFYAKTFKGKYEETENLFFSGDKLKNKNREIKLDSPRALVDEVEKGNLCPSLFLVFTAIAFLNRFKCFGSFAQVEYLPEYQKRLAGVDFMKKFKIQEVPTVNMTLGAFPNEKELFPADLIINNKKLDYNKNCILEEILIGMKNRLLGTVLKVPGQKR